MSTFKRKLRRKLNTQIYVASTNGVYTGILHSMTRNVIVVRSNFPDYSDITDHVIHIDQIAYVRLIP